jgi:pimeloyl-ACP methyl ester carboxylesterase
VKRFAVPALLVLACLFGVPNAEAASPVKNIVLVHGAWADGSSWAKVIPLLQAKGFNVVAVQNPLSSLADDVAATKRAIAQQDGPVVLVGHSWAGMVVSEAGNDPKVVGLVFISALVPQKGQSASDAEGSMKILSRTFLPQKERWSTRRRALGTRKPLETR